VTTKESIAGLNTAVAAKGGCTFSAIAEGDFYGVAGAVGAHEGRSPEEYFFVLAGRIHASHDRGKLLGLPAAVECADESFIALKSHAAQEEFK